MTHVENTHLFLRALDKVGIKIDLSGIYNIGLDPEMVVLLKRYANLDWDNKSLERTILKISCWVERRSIAAQLSRYVPNQAVVIAIIKKFNLPIDTKPSRRYSYFQDKSIVLIF